MNLTLPQIKKDPLAVGLAHDILVELVQRRGLGHARAEGQAEQPVLRASRTRHSRRLPAVGTGRIGLVRPQSAAATMRGSSSWSCCQHASY